MPWTIPLQSSALSLKRRRLRSGRSKAEGFKVIYVSEFAVTLTRDSRDCTGPPPPRPPPPERCTVVEAPGARYRPLGPSPPLP